MNQTGNEDVPSDKLSDLTPLESVKDVFYLVTMVIGVVGNVMVIRVILKVKDMLNSTNIFLANLAIADIMVLLLGSFGRYTEDNLDKIFGDNAWSVFHYISGTVINNSVLTVLAVGFERYYAVCQPLRAGFICTKGRAFKICTLAWVLAALSCSPKLLQKTDWFPEWRDYYFLTNTLIFFSIPPVVLIVLFSLIFRQLSVVVAPDVNTAAIRHRRQVITMLATVDLCFFLLQLPLRVFEFWDYFWHWKIEEWLENAFGTYGYSFVYYIFLMMVYLHSAVNPILYNLMSKRFRRGLKNICYNSKACCCIRQIDSTENRGSRVQKLLNDRSTTGTVVSRA